jgi:hypothetical protein
VVDEPQRRLWREKRAGAFGLGNDREATEAELDDLLAVLARDAAPTAWVQHGPASRTPEIPRWLEARGVRPAQRVAWAKKLRGTEPPRDRDAVRHSRGG